MRLPLLALVLAAAAAGASGCAKVQARTEPVMPELAPPPPPPRVVEMYVDGPVPTVAPGPVEAALATPPAAAPTRPPAPRVDPPKVEPPPIEPERPLTPAPAALTTRAVSGSEAKAVASIRAIMDRATRDLNRINFGALDADGRAQFGITQRFIQQADDALKAGNVSFASKLADKAATMAAVLIR